MPPVIIKKIKNMNHMDRKSAYTWGACLLAFFLIGATLLSLVGKDQSATNNFDSLKAKGYDLASMPFANDLAAQNLLDGPYSDIKADPVQSTLYSPQEEADRQAADAAGTSDSSPADDEYARAQAEQDAEANARAAYGGGGYQREKTEITQLGSGSGQMAAGLGGFSGGSMVWSPSNTGDGVGGGYGSGSENGGGGANGSAAARLRGGRAMQALSGVVQAARAGQAQGGLAGQNNMLKGFTGEKVAAGGKEKDAPTIDTTDLGKGTANTSKAMNDAIKKDSNNQNKTPQCVPSKADQWKMFLATAAVSIGGGLALGKMSPSTATAFGPTLSSLGQMAGQMLNPCPPTSGGGSSVPTVGGGK